MSLGNQIKKISTVGTDYKKIAMVVAALMRRCLTPRNRQWGRVLFQHLTVLSTGNCFNSRKYVVNGALAPMTPNHPFHICLQKRQSFQKWT